MTNIRGQAVVSLIIVGLSAAAAAGTPPDPHAVLIQYGVGTHDKCGRVLGVATPLPR